MLAAAPKPPSVNESAKSEQIGGDVSKSPPSPADVAIRALEAARPIIRGEYKSIVTNYGNGNLEEIEERRAYKHAAAPTPTPAKAG